MTAEAQPAAELGWDETWAWARDVWGPESTRHEFAHFFGRLAGMVAEQEGWDEVGSSDVWHLTIGGVRAAHRAGATRRVELVRAVMDYLGA